MSEEAALMDVYTRYIIDAENYKAPREYADNQDDCEFMQEIASDIAVFLRAKLTECLERTL